MKLTKQQVAMIEKKTGFSPVPEEAAGESGLIGHFGENTFYLDTKGVYVFEEVEQPSRRATMSWRSRSPPSSRRKATPSRSAASRRRRRR